MGECLTASDCNTTDPVTGDDIPKTCYKEVLWSDDTFFCDCSAWFGYTGEFCDQGSIQTRIFKASLWIRTLWSVVGAAFLLYVLFFYYRNKKMIPAARKYFWGLNPAIPAS